MKVEIVGSGSAGNCYILEDISGQQILLECGLKYDKISEHLNFRNLQCVLSSHKHQDHYLSYDKFEKLGLECYSVDNLTKNKLIEVGNYKILPIELFHNVECYGFMIYNTLESKKIIYCSDTTKIPKIADTIYDLIMFDTNYSKESIFKKAEKYEIENAGYLNHLSLEYIEEWLSNRKIKPKNFVAIHLSNSGNIYSKQIKEHLEQYVEKLYIATKKQTINF